MPRQPDLQRKPQLMGEILEYLLDKSLASVSFRTIAQALGVSTYTLVYHFGTRAQLLSEIVSNVSTRAQDIEEMLRSNPASLDAYIDGLVMSWEWTKEPRNRQLQRLEFEASLIEASEPGTHTFSRTLYRSWLRINADALVALGLTVDEAALESRLVVDSMYGLQYDYVLNGDLAPAADLFDALLARHRVRIQALSARPVTS